ncbi:MAG: hypothetical protein KAU22_03685 [Desulfuromonadales bacterium]|nr:hypothetical protein [Desulfuromonadales bacterium]
MDHRAIIDVVCKTGTEKLASEIGMLLGQDLICSDIKLTLTTKDNLFSNLERKKTALTRMSVEGDREGNCYLLNSISAAAILAGTLIMLPEDVIEDSANAEKLDGELEDAFGEVANIIAGVYTQSFVDKYNKSLRFIKQSVEELIPTKIDPASDQPFPPGNYYVASCNMAFGETDLGIQEFVVPAAIFDLEETSADTPAATPEAKPEPVTTAPEPTPEPEPVTATEEATPEPAAAPPPPPRPPFADAKKLTDVVFNATIGQLGEEIGALLGQPLKCSDVQLLMTSKADFFSNHCIEKSVFSRLNVTGEREGRGFMCVQVPDAVALGGTLIMLPEDQIEEQRAAANLDGETEDAYGEIANILAGGLTQVFLDRYPQQLRFIRTESETVVPTKVDTASEEPFPEGNYYLASFAITMDGFELQRILLIFPAEVFQLDDLPATATTPAAATAPEPAPGEWGAPPATPTTAGEAVGATTAKQPLAEPTGAPVVLLISDQETATAPFVEILSSAGLECQVLTFQDEVREQFQHHKILGIILIMTQVGEKGFASAIKLQSAGQPLPPIIFAGPEWTRSAVLRAVKYGAKDILIMPASNDEIQNKVTTHFKKAS